MAVKASMGTLGVSACCKMTATVSGKPAFPRARRYIPRHSCSPQASRPLTSSCCTSVTTCHTRKQFTLMTCHICKHKQFMLMTCHTCKHKQLILMTCRTCKCKEFILMTCHTHKHKQFIFISCHTGKHKQFILMTCHTHKHKQFIFISCHTGKHKQFILMTCHTQTATVQTADLSHTHTDSNSFRLPSRHTHKRKQ